MDTPGEKTGVITFAEQVCPGVFNINIRDDDTFAPRSFYVVTAEAVPRIISLEAARYGELCDDRLFFEEGVSRSGWELVDYEVSRYKLRQGIPLEDDNIYSLSQIYGERYPEYFGGLVKPNHVPFGGRVLRTKKAAEGLYFVETEKFEWLLAVHHVIWQDDDLSGYAKSLGIIDGQESDAPYMFFTLKNSTPAVYELLALHRYRKGLLKYIQSEDALAAALYRHHADYVVSNNLLELSGQGMTDMIGSLRKLADVMYGMDIDDAEYESPAEQREMNCISMPSGQPSRGKLFLLP